MQVGTLASPRSARALPRPVVTAGMIGDLLKKGDRAKLDPPRLGRHRAEPQWHLEDTQELFAGSAVLGERRHA